MSTLSFRCPRPSLLVILVSCLLVLTTAVGCTDGSDPLAATTLLAEQGSAEAQYNLGVAYGQGEGVTPNLAEAVRWYEKAAWQGHEGAQCELARAYNLGLGVESDQVNAMAWFIIAASQDPRGADIDADCGVAEVMLIKSEMEQAIAYSRDWTKQIRKSGWGPSVSERIRLAGAAFREVLIERSGFVPVELTVSFKEEWDTNTVEHLSFGKAEFRRGQMLLTDTDFSFLDGIECRLDEESVYRFSDGEWLPVEE